MFIQEFTNKLVNKLTPLVKEKIVIPNNKIIFNQSVYRDSIVILFDGECKLTHILPNSKEFTIGFYKGPSILLPHFFENDNLISLFRAQTKSTDF